MSDLQTILIMFGIVFFVFVIIPGAILMIHDGDNQRVAAQARRIAHNQRKN